MGFENGPGHVNRNEQNESSNEHNDSIEKLFELRNKIFGIDVSVSVEKGDQPILGSLDLQNKNAQIRITPEGLKKGLDFLSEALRASATSQESNTPTFFGGLADSIAEARKARRRRRHFESSGGEISEEIDNATIEAYAKQEGLTVEEVIREMMDSIDDTNRNR